MTNNNRGMVICYTAIFLLSLNGLFANTISLDAVSITQLRSLVAILAIAAFCFVRNRSIRLASKHDFIKVYFVGLLMGLHWVSYFYAMQVANVAVGMLALYTFPMITVLLEPFFHKQSIKLKDIVAALFVMLGILIIAFGQFDSTVHIGLLQGLLWGVVSAVFFTFRNLIQKYHLPHISSDSLMLHQLIAIAIMLFLFVDLGQVKSMDYKDYVLLFTLGVLTTAIAHTLLIAALKTLPAKTVAMLGCMQPIIGAFFAWLILSENVSTWVMIGGAIILSVAVYETLRKTV